MEKSGINNHATRNLLEIILVLVQFALIALLIWPPVIPPPMALILVIVGAALGLWTLLHNRIGNFNIRPTPKIKGHLVTTGPYRYIRHPMYTAVLLIMSAFAFFDQDWSKIIYWLLLLAILWIKSSLEEKMLQSKYPDYVDYQRTTGRFILNLFHRNKTN